MRRAIHYFGRVVDRIDRANTVVCVLLFSAVVLMAGAEVVSRAVFNSSSLEMVDLSLQLAILMYFIGYASLLNRDQDIRMDYFYLRFPLRVRKALDVLSAVAIAGFFLLLLIKSMELFGMGLRQRHPVFPIPNAVVIFPAVLGAAYGLVVAIRKALDTFTGHTGATR